MLSFPEFGFKASPGEYKGGLWEASGKTPVGKNSWSMRTTNNCDREDNDTSRTLTIGEDSSEDKKMPQLVFMQSCNQGRDWRSDTVSIDAKNPENGGKVCKVKIFEEAGRCGDQTRKMELEESEEVNKMIQLFATMEGMTANQFVRVLPKEFCFLANNVVLQEEEKRYKQQQRQTQPLQKQQQPQPKQQLEAGMMIAGMVVLKDTVQKNPTDDQVLEYGRFLGMQLPGPDERFLSIAREGLTTPLPDGWSPVKSLKDDKKYFFNIDTYETLRDHPLDEYFKKKFKDAKAQFQRTGKEPSVHGGDDSQEEEKIYKQKKEQKQQQLEAGMMIGGMLVLKDTVVENPTDEQVREYGRFLGMQLPGPDERFLYIAREGLKTPLPDGWKPIKSDTGDMYFFNFETGESLWDHPLDAHFKQKFKDAQKEFQRSGEKPSVCGGNDSSLLKKKS